MTSSIPSRPPHTGMSAVRLASSMVVLMTRPAHHSQKPAPVAAAPSQDKKTTLHRTHSPITTIFSSQMTMSKALQQPIRDESGGYEDSHSHSHIHHHRRSNQSSGYSLQYDYRRVFDPIRYLELLRYSHKLEKKQGLHIREVDLELWGELQRYQEMVSGLCFWQQRDEILSLTQGYLDDPKSIGHYEFAKAYHRKRVEMTAEISRIFLEFGLAKDCFDHHDFQQSSQYNRSLAGLSDIASAYYAFFGDDVYCPGEERLLEEAKNCQEVFVQHDSLVTKNNSSENSIESERLLNYYNKGRHIQLLTKQIKVKQGIEPIKESILGDDEDDEKDVAELQHYQCVVNYHLLWENKDKYISILFHFLNGTTMSANQFKSQFIQADQTIRDETATLMKEMDFLHRIQSLDIPRARSFTNHINEIAWACEMMDDEQSFPNTNYHDGTHLTTVVKEGMDAIDLFL